MNTFSLQLSWGISKGRDTYGYNICRLDAPGYYPKNSGTDNPPFVQPKRYRCSGGGYDMTGTVVGNWLQSRYQDRLMQLAQAPSRIGTFLYRDEDGRLQRAKESADRKNVLYGSTYYPAHGEKDAYVSLDGACGLSSMRAIAEAIGLSIKSIDDRKGRTTGFWIEDYGSLDALRASGGYVSYENRVQA